jgi:MATE family multidrug resistance protein
MSFRTGISLLFSEDPDTNVLIGTLLFFAVVFFLGDSLQTVFTSVLVSKGRRTAANLIDFLTYYLIAVSLMVVLAFVIGLDIYGIWIGMCTGAIVSAIMKGTYAFRTPWEKKESKKK